MRYQGGKSRIASKIVNKIRSLCPNASDIYEPFCGGGAVTLALARAGLRVHASDSHPDLIAMYQALASGDAAVFGDVTEEEYLSLRDAPSSARRGFVGFGASFGGSFFGGFGRNRTTERQPWQDSQAFILKLVEHLDFIEWKLQDYHHVPDDALVYADPPYIGTKPYKGTSFDHARFWTWVLERSGPTFVSELDAPDFMEVVWEQFHRTMMASNSPTSKNADQTVRIEKLFYKPADH